MEHGYEVKRWVEADQKGLAPRIGVFNRTKWTDFVWTGNGPGPELDNRQYASQKRSSNIPYAHYYYK